MEKIRQALDRARVERAAAEHPGRDADADRSAARAGPHVVDRETTPSAVPAAPRALPEAEKALVAAREFRPDAALLERNRIVAAGGESVAAQSFRMLRTQVLQRMRERGWQTLGVASARSRDGKTTVAANLSLTIAADPRHTALLVDLDFRRAGVASAFGLTPEVGIEDVLRDGLAVESCLLWPSGFPGLRILPARAAVASPSSLAADPACQALIGEFKARYPNRIVIVDMPPMLDADDALSVAALVDCVLFVVAEGRTSREDVTRALQLLRQTPVVGTVLNRAVEAVRSEAYG